MKINKEETFSRNKKYLILFILLGSCIYNTTMECKKNEKKDSQNQSMLGSEIGSIIILTFIKTWQQTNQS